MNALNITTVCSASNHDHCIDPDCACPCHTPKNITPTRHEKTEWTRFAHWAYEHGYLSIGVRYSINASMLDGESMTTAQFDSLQGPYRQWLIDGTVTLADARERDFQQRYAEEHGI